MRTQRERLYEEASKHQSSAEFSLWRLTCSRNILVATAAQAAWTDMQVHAGVISEHNAWKLIHGVNGDETARLAASALMHNACAVGIKMSLTSLREER